MKGVITRRAFCSIPFLQGWFNADPLEQRITAIEEDLEATKEALGWTLAAMQGLAQIIDNNTAYFEHRMDEMESRLPPPQKKKVGV